MSSVNRKPPAYLLCSAKDGQLAPLVYIDADKRESPYCPFHYWATIQREVAHDMLIKKLKKESSQNVNPQN